MERRIVRAVVLAGAGALLLMGLYAVLTVPVHHDIGWTLHLAEKMRQGATLYTDIIEINPPLIFWFALVASVAGDATGTGEVVAYHLLATGVVAGALVLTWYLLAQLFEGRHAWTRAFLVMLVAFLAGPFAGYEFGQREHLLFATLVPYVIGTAAFLRKQPLRSSALFAGGLLTAFGLAMKPFFVPIWLGTELYAWNRGGRSALLRPQALGVLAGFVAYGIAALWYARDYLQVARWGMAAYGDFFPAPLESIVLSSGTVVAITAVALLLYRSGGELLHVRRLAAYAIVVLLGAVYVQLKGWDYHWYPVLAMAGFGGGVALAGMLLRATAKPTGWRTIGPLLGSAAPRRVGFAVASLALLAAGAGRAHGTVERWGVLAGEPYFLPTMLEYVVPMAPEGRVLPITTTMQVAVPLVNYSSLRHASRFAALWMLPAAYREEMRAPETGAYHLRADMVQLEAYVFDTLLEDLAARPELLIVDRRPPSPRMPGFDYLAYLGQSAEFNRIFSEYLEVALIGNRYRIFLHSTAATAAGIIP